MIAMLLIFGAVFGGVGILYAAWLHKYEWVEGQDDGASKWRGGNR